MKVSVKLAMIHAAVTLAATMTIIIPYNLFAEENHLMRESASVIPSQSPKNIAMMWVAAYNSHDPDAAAALYDQNVTNVQMPWGKAVQGREAMRATYVKVFQAFPDIRVEIENVLEDGQWVVVEWHFSGSMKGEFAGHPPNNSQFNMRGCEIFQIVDGKIHSQRGYWDKATMFTQLNIKLDK